MTVKPSNELMSAFVEPIRLKKSDRESIAYIVNRESGKKLKLAGNNLILDRKPFRADPRLQKYQTKNKEAVKGIRYFLPNSDDKFVELTKPVYEDIVVDEYRSLVDSEYVRVFFKRLENACEHYVADLLLDVIRPEPSQVRKRTKQVKNASLKVNRLLRELDDRSRGVIEENFADIEPLLTYLDGLILACELVSQIKLSKELQARFNLCLAVVNAIHGLGLKPSSRKGGLAELLVKYLANNIAYGFCKHQANTKYFEEMQAIKKQEFELKERELKIQKERFMLEKRKSDIEQTDGKPNIKKGYIEDVNDSLSAAVVEFKRLSKQG